MNSNALALNVFPKEPTLGSPRLYRERTCKI